MRRAASLLIPAVLLAALAPAAAAQDSVFGIRGLGFLGRPVSARSAGMGGGEALFDGSSTVNPASLAAWPGPVGWAVGTGSRRTFDPGTGTVSLTSSRFPVFGFAAPAGAHLVLGVTLSDYLNRNWDVTADTTATPRDSTISVSDQTKSIGGVSDIRFAAAYRLSDAVSVGVGVHVLVGSARVSVLRQFPNDTVYHSFSQVSETDFSGAGVSFGAVAAPFRRLVIGASARFNGRLRAAAPTATAFVHLPEEYNGGLYFSPADGLALAATAGYASWSRAAPDLQAAGEARSRDVWSFGAGIEGTFLRIGRVPTPLRAGYRWRQLPFPVGADWLEERAVSGGFALAAAGGRGTVDVTLEVGSRAAGALTEHFTTLLFGVAILP